MSYNLQSLRTEPCYMTFKFCTLINSLRDKRKNRWHGSWHLLVDNHLRRKGSAYICHWMNEWLMYTCKKMIKTPNEWNRWYLLHEFRGEDFLCGTEWLGDGIYIRSWRMDLDSRGEVKTMPSWTVNQQPHKWSVPSVWDSAFHDGSLVAG